jgi:predicted ATPase
MLTRWTLENFKPIRERLDLPTAPLTVLAGLNSSGKSSFLQSILLISQTLANQKLDEPLVLNGPLVRLGTFQDVCNDRAKDPRLGIGFTLDGTFSGGKAASPLNARQLKRARETISMNLRFDPAPVEEGSAYGLRSTRAVLLSTNITVTSPGQNMGSLYIEPSSKSVDVHKATLEEEREFTSGLPSRSVQELPYSFGQNYVTNTPSSDTGALRLVQMAHFMPMRYVTRIKQLDSTRRGLASHIRQYGLSTQPISVHMPTLTLQLRNALFKTHRKEIRSRLKDAIDSINDVARRHSVDPFVGSTVEELAEWSLKVSATSDEKFSDQLAAAIVQPWPDERIFDVAPALLDKAAQHVIDTFSSTIRYLGPLRVDPNTAQSTEMYAPSGQPDDVGLRGEYAAAVYSNNRLQPIHWWNPLSQQIETSALESAMSVWVRYLGVADHVAAQDAAFAGVSWIIRSTSNTRERPLQAVGVGVSQVLPILVAGLLAPEGTILIMEQPELHLHERPQARLGDFFYGLTRVGKQVFVETHSAVLINQLRYLMVKLGQEARDAIAVYFVEQDEQGDARFEPIHISKGGAVENWPDGFFDESFRQEDRITREGIRARGKRDSA